MYVTTYSYDDYSDVKITVEVVIVDDLIFYENSYARLWRICCACALSKVNVNAHNLIYRIKRARFGRTHEYTRSSGTLRAILNDIVNMYSGDGIGGNPDYYTLHKLDDRWDAIANSIRAELW